MTVAARKHAWSQTDYTRQIAALIDKHWHRFGHDAWSRFLDDLLCDLLPEYRHARPLDDQQRMALREISGLYGEAIAACPPFTDLLGPVYMDVAGRGHKSAMGQFFTPESLCDMTAAMMLGDLSRQLAQRDPGNPLSILEPAVGSGAMLLAALRQVYQADPALLANLEIAGIDLDVTCVKMTTIQIAAPLIVHNLELARFAVYHGNALGDPGELRLFAGGVSDACARQARQSRPQPAPATAPPPAADTMPAKVQLTLF